MSLPVKGASLEPLTQSPAGGARSGVDVSPIVWVALLSFTNEILLGKQGLLVLMASKQ